MKNTFCLARLILVLGLITGIPISWGQSVPDHISYQGFLKGADGRPLGESTPANYNLVFRVFEVASGGTSLWAEQQVVTVDQGNFSVILGLGSAYQTEPHTPLSQVFGTSTSSTLYLGTFVVIDSGEPQEIFPRLRFLPSPYAFLATRALKVSATAIEGTIPNERINTAFARRDEANTFQGNQSVTGNLTVGGQFGVTGKVGIGVSNPAKQLEVQGDVDVKGTLNATAITVNGSPINTGGTSGVVPPGGIIMWSGSATQVPSGWALCNGSNGTPNLVNRFIVGAGGGGHAVGATGGTDSNILTLNHLPAHDHTFEDAYFIEHQNETLIPITGNTFLNGSYGGSGDSDNDNNRLLYRSQTTAKAGQANPAALDNRPAYYALAFIMKLAQ